MQLTGLTLTGRLLPPVHSRCATFCAAFASPMKSDKGKTVKKENLPSKTCTVCGRSFTWWVAACLTVQATPPRPCPLTLMSRHRRGHACNVHSLTILLTDAGEKSGRVVGRMLGMLDLLYACAPHRRCRITATLCCRIRKEHASVSKSQSLLQILQ